MRQRILIVDDDQDNLSNLSDILSDQGYDTEIAPSGEDAIEKIEEFGAGHSERKYDLCLLDFKLPGMDGVELYQAILKLDPDLRAIMITAYAGDDGIQRARDAGAWRVLRKPVDIKALLSMIREAFS